METYLARNRQDFLSLLTTLPKRISAFIEENDIQETIVEIILDLERKPFIIINDGSILETNTLVTEADLLSLYNHSVISISPRKNRAIVNNTLHRISFLFNNEHKVIGATIRVARIYTTAINLLQPLLENDHSILLIGRPGAGKSSRLREIARHLSTNLGKTTMIVDSNNEIAGSSDVPHFAVGKARRIMVPENKEVFECMLEAVENHMPKYVIIDEVSNRKEAKAVQSIAERGVKVIATVHGNLLEDVIKNPEINYMLGKIRSVTLGDAVAKKYNNGSKIRIEREFKSAFDSAVELPAFDQANIYFELEGAVDAILRGETPLCIGRKT